MNISDVLNGTVKNMSVEEQKDVLGEMKNSNIFDLSETERKNLVNFLCENTDKEIAVDYLFHVLDNEISYPIDDDKVKLLFSDKRMMEMKDLMMEDLQSDDSDKEV